MRFEEYRAHDAVGLAELVARGEVSAGELLDAAVTRMAEVNPRINAVTLDLSDVARTAAPGSGPLAGVPFLLKDLGATLAGTVTSGGSKLFADAAAEADSATTRLYKAAGLNIFGKTNTPEFGLWPVTESEHLGVCRNPWDLARTPGGSSGGAAAAVAAGIVPAAHASDGGGSIRTPAACCGLFGMKPSRGRVSFAPQGEGWAGASVQHAVTRSVRDSAALLDAVCAPQPGDPYFLPPPERPFLEAAGRDPGRLRIGFTTAALQSQALDPECAEAVRDAAKLCEDLGHAVEEVKVPGDFPAMQAAAGLVIAASVAANLDAEAERRGRPVGKGEVEGLTMATYRRGQGVTGSAYVQALATLHAFGRDVAALFETYDVLLLSTLGRPAIPIGWIFEDRDQIADRLFSFMPNTQPFNNSGQPAMTVPLAWSGEGLPIGLQFVGRTGEEAMLFSLAGQLERARPWFDRVAPL
ncbi:6-aminohexanoate-cyclic-dimer hydrolase [Phenylobacterium zucineum HLK1]|uniref:6-aminohexanoate-cyclic-dimer hydrolase n=1 Tax=Phenylobacterium zucineum (strain HLK1) TaxID=450851 RepID=B4R8I7_PHEZH|nr:amidase [Phenylobacterium zucineum]ACG77614.1 6-aminohexanoate-cyclic-dimer hydrolase [Phenylobacterium zucineum HLK1]